MAEADIALTVPAIVYAVISGIDSHGIATLLVYDPLVGDGTLNMTPNITTVTETPAVAVLAADRGWVIRSQCGRSIPRWQRRKTSESEPSR